MKAHLLKEYKETLKLPETRSVVRINWGELKGRLDQKQVKSFLNALRSHLIGIANKQRRNIDKSAITDFIMGLETFYVIDYHLHEKNNNGKWSAVEVLLERVNFMRAKYERAKGRWKLIVTDVDEFNKYDKYKPLNKEVKEFRRAFYGFVFPKEFKASEEEELLAFIGESSEEGSIFYNVRLMPIVNHSNIVYLNDTVLGFKIFYGMLVAKLKYPLSLNEIKQINDEQVVQAEYFILPVKQITTYEVRDYDEKRD